MTLNHIRKSIQKRQALYEAQLMMAKAYRGVPYTAAPRSQAPSFKTLTYRGQQYSC